MISALRIPYDCKFGWLDQWLVEQGDTVYPGKPMVRIWYNGAIEDIVSEMHGVCGWIDEYEGLKSSGDVIAYILSKSDRGAGKKAGLHPRPARTLRMRRLGLAA